MNVWFNQCFSTIYYTIKRYKEMYGDNLRIIGTSVNSDHVFKAACDEFYTEPDTDGEEYLKWALMFCKEHNIKIFFIKKHRIEISKYIDTFNAEGIVLVTDINEIHELFNSKSCAYEYLVSHGVDVKIPQYRVANTVEEFERCYKEIRETTGKLICYKLNADEGGGSYRIIVRHKSEMAAMQYHSNCVTLEEALEEVQRLHDAGIMKQFIIMEYLKGPEVSIDCYNTNSGLGLVCTPREKVSKRIEKVKHFENLEKSCESIQKAIGFKFPWNCQFRKDSITGEYKLLEINTRLSGGSHVGIDAGCWIGEYLIKDLLGENYNKPNFNEITIGKIEGHIIMEDN